MMKVTSKFVQSRSGHLKRCRTNAEEKKGRSPGYVKNHTELKNNKNNNIPVLLQKIHVPFDMNSCGRRMI